MLSVAMPTCDPVPPRAPQPERRELITLREAADLCTVDYETFRRWVAKGVLPHVAIGPHNLKRVYRRDVEKMLREVNR